MKKKRFADGGAAEGGGYSGSLPPLKPNSQRASTYSDRLQDWYLENSNSSFRNKKVPDMTLRDVARIPKEAALAAALVPAAPVAGFADEFVKGKKDYQEYRKKQDVLNARDSAAEAEDEAIGRAPKIFSRPGRQPLSEDQKRGVAREAALESRYGPSQAQRDRMERGAMKKGGAVKKMAGGGSVKTSSASRRGDGIAQRGKTKGRML
jgi:hypothetical protein